MKATLAAAVALYVLGTAPAASERIFTFVCEPVAKELKLRLGVFLSPRRISVTGDEDLQSAGWVARSRSGLCRRRAICFEKGPWMANVTGATGLRINYDVDDPKDLGLALECRAVPRVAK